MGDAALADQIGVEDDVALAGDFPGGADAGMEIVARFKGLIRDAGRAENDMAAIAEGAQGFLQLRRGIVRIGGRAVTQAKQAAVTRIRSDFFHQLRSGGQPAALAIIIVFVEVIGDFLNQQVGGP